MLGYQGIFLTLDNLPALEEGKQQRSLANDPEEVGKLPLLRDCTVLFFKVLSLLSQVSNTTLSSPT